MNGGACVNGTDSYSCTCADGFIGDVCQTSKFFLSVCLFVCLSVCLSVCVCVCLSLCLPVSLSVLPSVRLSFLVFSPLELRVILSLVTCLLTLKPAQYFDLVTCV